MDHQPTYGMALDLERCTGCHACSVACKVEHDVPLGHFRTKVYYHDTGKFPKLKRDFLPVLCMQCEDAPCLQACPTSSISRGADGIVRINANTCDGNGKCETACPYGAIFVDPITQTADKCDFCSNRLTFGMAPACVEACPTEVIKFGDLNDAKSPVALFMQRYGDSVKAIKPEKNTEPLVKYRGVGKEIEKKVAEYHNYDPFSYEIDTWATLQSDFTDKGES